MEWIADGLLEILLKPLFWCTLLLPVMVLATPAILLLGAFRSGHYFRDVKELYCGVASWWIQLGFDIL